jgi:hypothetical protein
MAYTLNVNGKALSADVDGDTPLLWTLRDTLGIVGPKYGCGVAACGACTVHVDGQPMRSCQIPTESVGKAKSDYTPYLKLDALQGARLGYYSKPSDSTASGAERLPGQSTRCRTPPRPSAASNSRAARPLAKAEDGGGNRGIPLQDGASILP